MVRFKNPKINVMVEDIESAAKIAIDCKVYQIACILYGILSIINDHSDDEKIDMLEKLADATDNIIHSNRGAI